MAGCWGGTEGCCLRCDEDEFDEVCGSLEDGRLARCTIASSNKLCQI